MGEWKEVTIGDYIDLISGYAFKSANFLDEQETDSLPVIKIKNVANGDVNLNDVVYHKYDNSLSKCLLSKGDILIAMTGNHPQAQTQVVGNVSKYKLNENALLNQRVGKFVSKNNTDLDFIYYLFKSEDVRNYLANQSSGSANQANISKGNILGLNLIIPQPFEQKAIASILSSLDDKIDLLYSQNATLEKMAETLFRQWFVEEAKDEWEDATLQQHTEAYRGLSYKGSGLAGIGNGLPMHNLNSVYEGGGYKYEGIKFYKDEYKERHIIYPGEIIVTNTEQGHEFRLIGFPAIVPNSFGNKGLFSQHIFKLIIKKDSYLSRQFIYYLLMTPNVREQIIAATNGSTVNMLAIDGLQRPEFKLPPQSLVKKFTEIVSAYWEKKDLNRKQIHTLATLRDTLLPKLMNGEVKVQTN